MGVQEWIIHSPQRHEIRLEYGVLSGTAQLFVDGALLYSFGFGAACLRQLRHRFEVDGVPVVVQSYAAFPRRDYACFVDLEDDQHCARCGEQFAYGCETCPMCGAPADGTRLVASLTPTTVRSRSKDSLARR